MINQILNELHGCITAAIEKEKHIAVLVVVPRFTKVEEHRIQTSLAIISFGKMFKKFLMVIPKSLPDCVSIINPKNAFFWIKFCKTIKIVFKPSGIQDILTLFFCIFLTIIVSAIIQYRIIVKALTKLFLIRTDFNNREMHYSSFFSMSRAMESIAPTISMMSATIISVFILHLRR